VRRKRRRKQSERLGAERLEDRTLLNTYTWTGADGQSWSDPGNWTGGDSSHAPESADTAIVNTQGGTVVFDTTGEPSNVVERLQLSGGTLQLGAALTVAGEFDWSGGTITGTGTLNATGSAYIAGSSTILDGCTLNNAGHAFNVAVTLNNGAVINNQPGAEADLNDSGASIDQGSGAPGTFNNEGFVIASRPLYQSDISVNLINAGTVEVASGTLEIFGNGSATGGKFQADANTNLVFRDGTFNFDSSSTLTGGVTGTFTFFEENSDMAGTYSGGGVNVQAGSSITFTGSQIGTPTDSADAEMGNVTVNTSNFSLDLSNATRQTLHFSLLDVERSSTLQGNADFVVDSPSGWDGATPTFTWNGGTIGGAGFLRANSGMAMDFSYTRSLDARELDLYGFSTISATGTFAFFDNCPGINNYGTIDFAADQMWQDHTGGGAPVNNYGTITKSVGAPFQAPPAFPAGVAGGTQFDTFNNYGSVELDAGVFNVVTGQSTGSFIGASGTWFAFGRYTFLADPDGTPPDAPISKICADNVWFDADPGFEMDGTYNVTGITTIEGGGGTFKGRMVQPPNNPSSTLTILNARFDYTPADPQSNPLVVRDLHLNGTDPHFGIGTSADVTVTGTLDWGFGEISGLLDMNGNAPTLTVDGETVGYSDTGHTIDPLIFDTYGNVTLRDSGGFKLVAGTVWNNFSGSVDNQSILSGTGVYVGALRNDGTVHPGDSPGRITIDGPFTQTNLGTLQISIGGTQPAIQFSELEVNGAISLAGALQVNQYGTFIPQAGNTFAILRNDAGAPISGIFNGLPEGSITTVPGQDQLGHPVSIMYRISYQGVDPTSNAANCVTLTAVAATTTALTSSANPSALNQGVNFTATVSAAGGGTAAGTVQFQVDAANFGPPVALSAGHANVTIVSLPVGPHTITALYSGSSAFLTSSVSLAQNVVYSFSGFLAPVSFNRAFKQGSSIPIKWQLTDVNGIATTSLSAVRSLVVAVGTSAYVLYNGATNTSSYTDGGTAFRNNGGQYSFNWSTKGFATGSYTLTATLNDGTARSTTIVLNATGANASLVIDGTGSSSTTAGALLAGDLTLYVDNSNGELTSDDQARILDAVTEVEALVSPYGTNVYIVDSSIGDDANIVVVMSSTSAVGGQADGVLGCTTDNGLVVIVDGWNWYAGADAIAIGSQQYDFQTVVTHELGHALGLGHSADAASVMYPMLASGGISRVMTAQDLNVPDAESGAGGLHVRAAQPSGSLSAPISNAPVTSSRPGTERAYVLQLLSDVNGATLSTNSRASSLPAARDQTAPARGIARDRAGIDAPEIDRLFADNRRWWAEWIKWS
jgi:hypothetical protein